MTHTISEVAERAGITAYTLRYYDKEGLLPFVDRNRAGVRLFKDSDYEWLAVITCLKKTGMPIKKIREFIDWCMEGDGTLHERLQVFVEHKKRVQEQVRQLTQFMEKIEYKIWYYETAIKAGTEDVHKNQTCRLAEGL